MTAGARILIDQRLLKFEHGAGLQDTSDAGEAGYDEAPVDYSHRTVHACRVCHLYAEHGMLDDIRLGQDTGKTDGSAG